MANFSVEWLSKSYYESSKVPSEINVHGREYSTNSTNNTSGSESDAGEDSGGEAAQLRPMRTKFSSEQLGKLEGAFSRCRYLGAAKRRTMADKLKLSETQVKTWFQNRRMKLKRESQDRDQDFHLPVVLLLPPRFQHPALSGQLRGLSPQLRPLHGASLSAQGHQHLRPQRFRAPHFY